MPNYGADADLTGFSRPWIHLIVQNRPSVSAPGRNYFYPLSVIDTMTTFAPMFQQLLVGLVFLAALGFLATLVVRSFRAKEGCATGCGKCGVTADPAAVKPKP
jgi:hypothetical protein